MDLELETRLAGTVTAHRVVCATVAALDDATARRPSLLPGWSVGHVITHIARNADSFTNIVGGALEGRVADQYPGGVAMRDGDIEAGSGRSAAALFDDLASACARLEEAWAAVTAAPGDLWATGQGHMLSGHVLPLPELPFRRWREVEVHHLDMGLAFGFDQWSPGYVERELALALPALAGRLPAGTPEGWQPPLDDPARVVAWLLDRHVEPGWPSLRSWG